MNTKHLSFFFSFHFASSLLRFFFYFNSALLLYLSNGCYFLILLSMYIYTQILVFCLQIQKNLLVVLLLCQQWKEKSETKSSKIFNKSNLQIDFSSVLSFVLILIVIMVVSIISSFFLSLPLSPSLSLFFFLKKKARLYFNKVTERFY